MYGAVPPDAIPVAVPSQSPLQEVGVCNEIVTFKAVGSDIVAAILPKQLLESNIETI